MKRKRETANMLIALALLIAGCRAGPSPSPADEVVTTVPEATTAATVVPEVTAEATDSPEYTYSQLLSRDAIRPIYNPGFVSADRADYRAEELGMGVVIEGEAKAYRVELLNSREMVNDELAGIPILVTF